MGVASGGRVRIKTIHAAHSTPHLAYATAATHTHQLKSPTVKPQGACHSRIAAGHPFGCVGGSRDRDHETHSTLPCHNRRHHHNTSHQTPSRPTSNQGAHATVGSQVRGHRTGRCRPFTRTPPPGRFGRHPHQHAAHPRTPACRLHAQRMHARQEGPAVARCLLRDTLHCTRATTAKHHHLKSPNHQLRQEHMPLWDHKWASHWSLPTIR